MSGVEFENEKELTMSTPGWQPQSEQPAMVRWLMGRGIAKTPAQANGILLGIAVIAFLLSLYFFFFGGPRPAKIQPPTIIPGAAGPGGVIQP